MNKQTQDILSYLAVSAITAILFSILVSKYKDRAYKELMKKHDKETAERLSKEFNQKLESLKEDYENETIKTKEEFKKKVSVLCREYGINPKPVVK